MDISSINMQEIADEISGIVKKSINIMNQDGFIIASTNPDRIGTFHTGAKKIIAEELSELVIGEDSEYAKKGINLPIQLGKKIVGVVGISGEYDEVVKFALVVKKMTEIMIKDKIRLEENRFSKLVRERFLEDWLFNINTITKESVIERGQTFGIDVNAIRRVFVVSIKQDYEQIYSEREQRILEEIHKAVEQIALQTPSTITLRNSIRQIILMRNMSKGSAAEYAQCLFDSVLKKYGARLIIGIGENGRDCHNSYLQANKAWQVAKQSKNLISFFDDLDFELLTSNIPRRIKVQYLNKIYKDTDKEGVEYYARLIECYFDTNGSIEQMSKDLFMHKNSVQYKIRKLAEISGYDLRKPKEASKLFVALRVYQELQDDIY